MKEGEIINKNKFKRELQHACDASYLRLTTKSIAFQ